MSRVAAGVEPGARIGPRSKAALATAAAILVGGIVVMAIPREKPSVAAAAPAAVHPHEDRIRTRFEQAVVMLHAKRYEHAITALHDVLRFRPEMPEAHVNMGFALVGVGRHAAARDFFESATVLRPTQANAYYGLAVALEGLEDVPGAVGAMRTFLHLAAPDDRHRRKAEAALWEWESAIAGPGNAAGAITNPEKGVPGNG